MGTEHVTKKYCLCILLVAEQWTRDDHEWPCGGVKRSRDGENWPRDGGKLSRD